MTWPLLRPAETANTRINMDGTKHLRDFTENWKERYCESCRRSTITVTRTEQSLGSLQLRKFRGQNKIFDLAGCYKIQSNLSLDLVSPLFWLGWIPCKLPGKKIGNQFFLQFVTLASSNVNLRWSWKGSVRTLFYQCLSTKLCQTRMALTKAKNCKTVNSGSGEVFTGGKSTVWDCLAKGGE